MKAVRNLMGAASAVALSSGMMVSGQVALQLASMSVAQAAVVSSISISGNQRIDDQTIRSYVGIEPGRSFSPADIDQGVKNLFGTGLFSDVRISQRGSTLVVEVDEHPVVNQVLFQGNKKHKDSVLQGVVQLKPRGTFSQSQMEADAQAIRDAYSRIGRDDATVTSQVMDLGENRVNVVFTVQEGGRTKIATVNFVGNNAFGDRRLSDVVSTKRSNFLSFMFRDDIYDEQRLRADEEALRRFYYSRGYADFQVVSSNAELNEAENKYTVTFTVDEGERYTFGDVAVESSIEGIDANALNSAVETHTGDVYNANKVENTIIGLTEQVAGAGFAFAQVTPRGDRNFENRTISVVYTIDQGPRTYIERIEIRGNSRTRDYVIRREFDLSEGDAFNQVFVQRAKRRLERLDYFETVNISTAPGSEPDQVVLVVDVVEKSTGEFSVGAGYSTSATNGGFSVEGSISERNFLGRGQFIKISAGGGKNSRDFGLSFTEPYFLGRRIAAGFDLYRQTRQYTKYDSEMMGGTLRLGLPITDRLSTTFAYNLTKEEYSYSDACDTNGDGIADACVPGPALADGVAKSPWVKSSVSATLQYNSIDNMKNPRDGLFASFTTEAAGLGGDAQWLKFTARGSYYKTLSEEMDLVGVLNVGAGHIQPFGSDGLRLFDQFQSTDKMIRGFESGGMGPVDTLGSANPDVWTHLGGKTYFNASAEAQFPLPVVPPSLGMRGAVFADAATLFGVDSGVAATSGASFDMHWRASVGVGLIWASPFGPIRIDYAVPVLKEPTDIVQNLNFGVSTRF